MFPIIEHFALSGLVVSLSSQGRTEALWWAMVVHSLLILCGRLTHRKSKWSVMCFKHRTVSHWFPYSHFFVHLPNYIMELWLSLHLRQDASKGLRMGMATRKSAARLYQKWAGYNASQAGNVIRWSVNYFDWHVKEVILGNSHPQNVFCSFVNESVNGRLLLNKNACFDDLKSQISCIKTFKRKKNPYKVDSWVKDLCWWYIW